MNDDILEQAIVHYGKTAQLAVAIGEIGELLTVIGRDAQGRATEEDWIDEIADVTIMLRQLAIMIGVEETEARVEAKIARLAKILEEATK